MEIEIKGHSGCAIDIVKKDNILRISKSTTDHKYVDRLQLQANKQKDASNISLQHIRVPEVLSIEKDVNHCTVLMEYVYSRNYIEFFENAGFEQIGYFIKALKIWLDFEIKSSPIINLDRSVVLEKFEGVKLRIQSNSLLCNNDAIINIMKQSDIVFNSLPELIKIPIGKCHGDLTFSNILFNGNNYYMIDFLDSFIESPLMDMVKIRQDSKYLWSTLMYTGHFDNTRLMIISSKIDQVLNEYFVKFSWYNEYYATFQLMNFLRILQYANKQKVIDFLKETINQILSDEKFISNSRC